MFSKRKVNDGMIGVYSSLHVLSILRVKTIRENVNSRLLDFRP